MSAYDNSSTSIAALTERRPESKTCSTSRSTHDRRMR
jgi:hypothetical protein